MRLINLALETCKKIPSRRLKHIIYKGLKFYWKKDRNKIVFVKRERVNFKLDLSELIDNAIYRGLWERGVTNIFKKYIRKNDIVIDVGANIGYYTLLSAKIVGDNGRVYAFEPSQKVYKKLKYNISLNNFKNIITECLGVSDKENKERLCLQSSYKIHEESKIENTEIDMITLDSYIKRKKINKVDFIKIDTDGFDFAILKGAINTIKKFRPTIIVETDLNEEDSEDFLDFLFSLKNYEIYSDREKRLRNKGDIRNEFRDRGIMNVALIPNDRKK